MKILNREKTHFMQPCADGTRHVRFGKVNEVSALIDTILDGEKDKDSDISLPDSGPHVVNSNQSDN